MCAVKNVRGMAHTSGINKQYDTLSCNPKSCLVESETSLKYQPIYFLTKCVIKGCAVKRPANHSISYSLFLITLMSNNHPIT